MQRNGRDGVYLVYSSSLQPRDEVGDSASNESNNVWGQLELFSSEKPDTVIITQPDRIGLDGISRIIINGHARRIFDLREMPFISFGNETRESFLDILERNKTEYYNVFKLFRKLCEKAGQVEHAKMDSLPFLPNCDVKNVLKPMIESGPTVVFSDTDPAGDESVKKLLDLLSRSSIPYSPVFAESGTEKFGTVV
jgi:hypothetical protein